MKHTFGSQSECAHVFAQQVPEQEYGNAGNFSFRENVAYSYGHYAITQIVNVKKKQALVQSNTYSSSTSQHIGACRSALSHYDIIYVPTVDGRLYQHKENIVFFMCEYDKALEKGKRSLKYNNYTEAKQALEQSKKYCSWFPGIKKTLSTEHVNFVNRTFQKINTLIAEKTAEIYNREERLNSPKHIAKRNTDTEKRYGKQVEKLRKLIAESKENCKLQIEKWKKGEENNAYYPIPIRDFPLAVLKAVGLVEEYRYRKPYGNIDLNNDIAYLRLNADRTRIETSKHAQVLVEHAVKLWPVIERSYREQAEYPGNGFKIDYYTVTKIDKGNLIIGCHNIPYSEIESIAKQLHLI